MIDITTLNTSKTLSLNIFLTFLAQVAKPVKPARWLRAFRALLVGGYNLKHS